MYILYYLHGIPYDYGISNGLHSWASLYLGFTLNIQELHQHICIPNMFALMNQIIHETNHIWLNSDTHINIH